MQVSYSKHITKILLLNGKKNQSSYFESRYNTNKTPTHDQGTTNFTWKYIIDRKATYEISPMFISIELVAQTWNTLVHSLKAKSIYFFCLKCQLYLSPKSEVALFLSGQSYFLWKILKSKEQLTFTKCDFYDRTLKTLKNNSPGNIISQTTTLVAVIPGT